MGVLRQFGPVFHQRSMSMPPLERKSPHKGGGEQRRQMGCLRGKLDIDLRRFQARLKQRMELSFEQRHTEDAQLAPRIRCVNPNMQKIPFL